MSENQQQNQSEYVIRNFRYEFNSDDSQIDKLNMYSQELPTSPLTTTNSQYHSCDEYGDEPLPWPDASDQSYFEANAKVQNDLNIVRDCLGHRMRTEEQAIESLWEGKDDECKEKFQIKYLYFELMAKII